jgi:hypothetical protein
VETIRTGNGGNVPAVCAGIYGEKKYVLGVAFYVEEKTTLNRSK